MRSHLSRLSYAGGLLLALSACNDAIDGLPNGGSVNTGGGGVVNTNPGIGTVPANSIATKSIDDGTVAKGKYTGFNTTATDSQSVLDVGVDQTTPPVKPNPPSPSGPTDGGSHSILFNGNGLTQVILGYGGTVPNLTYQYGPSGNSTYYNYSTIAMHITYAPGMTSPGTLTGLAVEFTGGSGTTAYDVRVPCTLPVQPPTSTPAPVPTGMPTAVPGTSAFPMSFGAGVSLTTCSGVPAYPTAGLLGNGPDTLGPNAVTPGVTGQFTPMTPKMYLVLTYAGTTATAGQATLGVDYVYAKQ